MAEVKWSAEAKQYVAKLGSYLAENYGEDYADRVLDSIEDTVNRVAKHPTKGRPADKLGKTRRRKLDRHNFMVYEITDNGIEVLSLHAYKQDLLGF